ncbi:MAG: HDOD domain-containing protein [Sterolibacteriaceae bacterium MAG5]|nr:HDOD domain-containing protein [Candidatus Nitricoxidireducens bremensis]
MSAWVRREPIVNRQMATTASRLIVRADSAREAVDALNGLADTWPTTRNVIVGLQGAAPDDALLDWQPPANALLEFPAPVFASVEGQALAAQLDAGGTPLCLGDYAPGMALPETPKFRFALADASRHPQLDHAPATPLATNLANHGTFGDAVENGYSGAAGWFFLHGLPAMANKLNPGHAQIIHILNLVRQNAEVAEIEAALKKDISISFKLLRYINSAGFGLGNQIQSFRHAVTLIGYNKLNKWLSLLLVTASRDPAAPALMQTSIVRGRFMELAAADSIDRGQLDNLFITGSFSLLDVLLGSKIDAVLAEMNLPEAIADALLRRAGPYAPWLALALACEQDDVPALAAQAAALGLDADRINRAQIEALAFADNLQLD